MSLRAALSVAGIECAKLAGQIAPRLMLASCVVGPFVFCAAVRLQDTTPSDTLFGRAVKESGFAVSLVVLGFATIWLIPMLASVVGGDLFSAEDRHHTWQTLLTRSCSRAELFTGKVVTALGFCALAIAALAASSVVAGVMVIGPQPLIDLSGVLRSPMGSLPRVTLAWVSILPPAFGFTALAVLLSVLTRNSAAGIGLPILVALTMQLAAFLDAPVAFHRVLITTAFGAWHSLLTEPPSYIALVRGASVSAGYFVLCLVLAYRLIRRRDITS